MKRTAGLVAMAVTVVVWAGFALSIRGIGASSLTTADAALIRFGLPVVLLSPWIPRTLRALRTERPLVAGAVCLGAGLPYFLVAALGGRLTSAALVGMVIPGSVPVFVTLMTRTRPVRAAALAMIVTGAGVAAWSGGPGVLVLLLAGLIWSVYTVGLRATGLDPIGAALLVCAPSALVTALLLVTGTLPSHLGSVSPSYLGSVSPAHLGAVRPADLLTYLVVQGAGVGVLAALAYAYAIRHLGGPTAATLGAASPVLTALAAVPLFGERLTVHDLVSLALIVAGVVTFSAKGATRHDDDPAPTEDRRALAAHRGLRG
ncbi:EamA family transporter [Actinoplanes sp. NPDC051851]|uniref:EamA family transporter n=1 Tax=Actinoplanes sp. NPDC051851 TaxID=3154753 RepID=UPI003436CB64